MHATVALSHPSHFSRANKRSQMHYQLHSPWRRTKEQGNKEGTKGPIPLFRGGVTGALTTSDWPAELPPLMESIDSFDTIQSGS